MEYINVAIGCVVHNNEILLNKRIEKDILNIHEMWELPGGKVENDELLEQTVVREIYEETGCKVSVENSLPFHFNILRIINNKKVNIVLNCFICSLIESPNNFKNIDDKIGELKWFKFEEIEFLQIMAGSREFIYWILKNYCSIDLNLLNNSEIAYIVFENIDYHRNHYKQYHIVIQFLPNEYHDKLYCLSLQFGRIGKKTYTNNEYYKDEFSLHDYLTKILNRRISHGYYVVKHENFPLKDWLLEHQDHIKPSQIIQKQIEFIK
ncbi:MAG: NUDIX domain-containing protein [Ignavibacteriae bacterium]|nr:MAG: NUDIX domain-containing protein [Ignavibacteriota bacterium]